MIKDLSTWLWTLAICMIPPVGLFILGVYESRHEKHKRRQLWCVDDVDDAINDMHQTGGEVHKTLDVVFTQEDGLQFTPDKHVTLWNLEDSDGMYTITHGSIHKKICASANALRITKKTNNGRELRTFRMGTYRIGARRTLRSDRRRVSPAYR